MYFLFCMCDKCWQCTQLRWQTGLCQVVIAWLGPKMGIIFLSLFVLKRSHILLETSVFGWFWIKVYFPIKVVLSHVKYFLAWVQLAISHCSMQLTGFLPVATSPWPEAKHAVVVAGKALPQLCLCRDVPTECPALALCWLDCTWDRGTVVSKLLKRSYCERESQD